MGRNKKEIFPIDDDECPLTDVYDNYDEMLSSGSITPAEAAFMRGYTNL